MLTERIREIHAESDATYGMPRVRAELLDQGMRISRKRVARLMRLNAIRGISRRRGFVVTTRRDERQRPAPDLVKREFVADGPNQLWVADMTYVPTWAGFIYLAVVLDVWSRRIVGWAIGEQMTAELVLAALNMALQQRKPDGVIHHSDQGSQYTSIAFGERCKKMGVRPSMGTVGDAYDNAMAESFFASLECELIDRRSWQTKTEARLALFTWIEGWYNPRRRHSALGHLSPANFERSHHEASRTPPQRLEHGLPTVGVAWHAPRRRWTTLRRSHRSLENQAPTVRGMGSSPVNVLNTALAAWVPPGLIHLLPIAAFAFAIALSMPLLVGHALHPFPDNAGLAASCQMFLQYSMMAVAAGLLAPLLWDSLSHLALGCAVLTSISMALLLWQRSATHKATRAAVSLEG